MKIWGQTSGPWVPMITPLRLEAAKEATGHFVNLRARVSPEDLIVL
jgi:hypothetical protein